MKTLLITGVYYCLSANLPVLYDIELWGQTKDNPQIQLISVYNISLSGYDNLINFCRAEYSRYFKTDDSNITILDYLHSAKDYFKYAND